ncbi:MAG: hypothetical protein RLN88_03675 [Ekhidna sp.]|uniref:hypothetical protein n=1 Tax=Ekhidna sp. TaxID=2608089 RepID=UPI0032EB9355
MAERMENIYVIEIPLSTWIPIESGSTLVSNYDMTDYKVSFAVTFHVPESEKNDQTVITTKFLLTDSKFHDLPFSVRTNLAVIWTIRHINRLFDVIRNSTDFHQISRFSILDLPAFIKVWYNNDLYDYLTNPKKEEGKLEIKKEYFQGYLQTLDVWENHPEIEVIDKYHGYAKYHLDREEMTEAVIDLQTSFEVFLRHSYKVILTVEGKKIPETIYEIPLRNLLTQHLSKYLKVDLSYDKNPTMESWRTNLYNLRNKIIHEGFWDVDGNQAYQAYDAYFNTRNYLADLMRKRGYLNEKMDIDLTMFRKNIPSEIDHDQILRELKRKNMLPDNVKLPE